MSRRVRALRHLAFEDFDAGVEALAQPDAAAPNPSAVRSSSVR
jgi:hypothetical protein